MKKNQNGITLIALVITIIVLLILAGVSIAMLTGDNGILNQATRAKGDSLQAEAADKINMALNAEYGNILADKALSTDVLTANGLESADFVAEPATDKSITAEKVLEIKPTTTGKYKDYANTMSGTITYDSKTEKYTITPASYPVKK